MRRDPDQALPLQALDGLANRGPADPQFLRQVWLVQLGSRGQVTAPEALAEHLVHLVAQITRLDESHGVPFPPGGPPRMNPAGE